MDSSVYIIAFLIILGASLIQGITSFGFSLLAFPLLTLVLPIQVIVPILVIYALTINIAIFSKIKGHVNKKQIFVLVLFGVVSIPIGINILKYIDDNIIKLLVGILITISAISMNFGIKIKFKNQNIAYALTGLISGILNGSTSLTISRKNSPSSKPSLLTL